MANHLNFTNSPDDQGTENSLPGHLSPEEKVKKAEEIAIQSHFLHPYLDHKENGDYYKYHLDVVRKTASRLAEEHSNLPAYKIEIAALLHDYLEDTRHGGQDFEDLVGLFGEELLQSIEKLTYRPEKSYEEYIKNISEDEIAKIAKAAARIANISALKGLQDKEMKKKLFQKYILQFELFENMKYSLRKSKKPLKPYSYSIFRISY